MNRVLVQSSNLRSVGYDATTSVLEIEFHHGGIYHYMRVPQTIRRGLMSASSKGTYFQDHIRDHYTERKVR